MISYTGNNQGLKHGRAWGVQVLKGESMVFGMDTSRRISDVVCFIGRTMENGKPVEIRGGLKYNWKLLA